MRIHENKRGASLVMVLVMSTVAFLVLGSLFSTTDMHLRSTRKVTQSKTAADLADSALLIAIEKLKDDVNHTTEVVYPMPDAPTGLTAEGRVTFSTSADPYSTNNLIDEEAETGWKDTVVPGKTAHLVAKGQFGQEVVLREAFVHIPPFPYSISTAGKLRSSGSLEVFALESFVDMQDGILDEEKLPGHLVSNAADEWETRYDADGNPYQVMVNPAVLMGTDTDVTGDAQSVGTVHLQPFDPLNPGASQAAAAAVVKGQVLANHSPEKLPDVQASDFDPEGKPYTYTFDGGDTVEGRARYSGDLTLSQDVSLDNGILYVDGNLTIDGDLSGVGAIVCTGNLTVNGSMNVASDMAALVADGNVSINGDGPASSSFQGLVYAGGSFSASNTQIVGAFVDADAAGTTSLANVKAVHAPELTSLDIMGEAVTPGVNNAAAEVEGLTVKPVPITAFPVVGNNYQFDASLVTYVYQGVEYSNPNDLPASIQSTATQFQQQIETEWTQWLQTQTPDTVNTFPVFDLDLNKFLRLSDKIRVLVWRTI